MGNLGDGDDKDDIIDGVDDPVITDSGSPCVVTYKLRGPARPGVLGEQVKTLDDPPLLVGRE